MIRLKEPLNRFPFNIIFHEKFISNTHFYFYYYLVLKWEFVDKQNLLLYYVIKYIS